MKKIITLIGRSGELIDTHEAFDLCRKYFSMDINSAKSNANFRWLAEKTAAEFIVAQEISRNKFRDAADKIRETGIDIFISSCPPDYITGKNRPRWKKLLICDMDMTIVQSETLDEVAKASQIPGIGEKISEITKKAMNGEIEFSVALKKRISLLAGMPVEIMENILSSTQITIGAQELISIMKENGSTTILITGGFDFFSEKIAATCGFDYNFSNHLEIREGKLTGKVIEPILDKNDKERTLHEFSLKLKCGSEDVLAIGDGANDLPMLKAASMGIGYYPKKTVADEIDNIIVNTDLRSALYAQGYAKQ